MLFRARVCVMRVDDYYSAGFFSVSQSRERVTVVDDDTDGRSLSCYLVTDSTSNDTDGYAASG